MCVCWSHDLCTECLKFLSLKKLEELLDGADYLAVNARDVAGQTPLHCYVRRGQVDYLITLLSLANHVDVNAQDNEDNTALHMAVMVGKKSQLTREKERACLACHGEEVVMRISSVSSSHPLLACYTY